MMELLIGGLFIVWGAMIVYAALFRLKKKDDYKDDIPFGARGDMEWELLCKVFNSFPYGLIKSVVILMGISFIIIGVTVI
ncbi:hypothetical protein MUN89_05970 [Halobacillus salinarum]|uniref:Uncharacterized protein n=1 Tax=Halobacillus salinarum TaxID=2932257 RepID=A0ABY4ETN1_9BACI|nr:hypothetical protein [Halobacillus salinarum]UOQ45491.1 hypothetical protein MUN89_05970 [Halobacillus salinarum]